MRPVILIGAARSGTKFLRDTLAAADDVCAVPYDINYVWRHGNEAYQSDVIPGDSCSESTRRYITNTVHKLACKGDAGAGCKIILEKTVSNCLRVDYVNAVFPDALFIHLVRDGRDVIESSFRMWQKPSNPAYIFHKLKYFPLSDIRYAFWIFKELFKSALGEPRIWGPRYNGIRSDLKSMRLLEVCARQWTECVDSAMQSFDNIPDKRVLTIRYEDLVADERCVRSACEFIGLDDCSSVISAYRNNVMRDQVCQWTRAWNTDDTDAVMRIAGTTLERLHYL